MPAQTILVIGGTGYLGSHVISQLLADGFNVRATARSAAKLRTIFPHTEPANDRLEIVEVPDLTADHTQALKGVDALIHCGSPTFFRGETLTEILEGAYHGAVDVIEMAIKVGVKKIIYTSSMVTLVEPGFSNFDSTIPLNADSWGSLPLEKIDLNPSTSPGQAYVYQTAKTAAERKIWEMADQHPEIDFTSILPSTIWGPFIPNLVKTLSDSPGSLGTVGFLRDLLDNNKYPQSDLVAIVDVRDVARAHVLALHAPPILVSSPIVDLKDEMERNKSKEYKRKRLIITHRNFRWEEVIQILRGKYARDENVLKRLPEEEEKSRTQLTLLFDTSLAEKVIGFGGYVPFEDTVLETLKAYTLWESRFKA